MRGIEVNCFIWGEWVRCIEIIKCWVFLEDILLSGFEECFIGVYVCEVEVVVMWLIDGWSEVF